jgi:hypothetical protein
MNNTQTVGYTMVADNFNIHPHSAYKLFPNTLNQPPSLYRKTTQPHAKDVQSQGGVNLHMPILPKGLHP